MTIKASGVLSLTTDIRGEFGGTTPHRLSEYYRGGNVPDVNTNVPTSGAISMSDFYGARSSVTVIYELIGAGGGGGGGGNGGGTGGNGGASSITGTGFTNVSAAGGAGGAQNSSGVTFPTDGESTDYGAGGVQGISAEFVLTRISSGSAPASTAYGAGGGGGGSDFDQPAGWGGGAGTRVTGSQSVTPGTELTVTVGTRGGGGSSGSYSSGGAGANGYVRITVGNSVTEFTSSGTYTVP